jgi:hypothetical protein
MVQFFELAKELQLRRQAEALEVKEALIESRSQFDSQGKRHPENNYV